MRLPEMEYVTEHVTNLKKKRPVATTEADGESTPAARSCLVDTFPDGNLMETHASDVLASPQALLLGHHSVPS